MIEKNCSTEGISEEIRELVKCVDDYIQKKESIFDNLKKIYLNTSTNN